MKEKNEDMKPSEKFELTDEIKTTGYSNKIEGRLIVITPTKKEYGINPLNGQNEVHTTQESFVYIDSKPTGKDYFEDLTDEQMHQLLIAKVIKLSKGQKGLYRKYLEKKYASE
jgi:hypothetical protein